MSITILFGSPNTDGLTETAAKRVQSGIVASGKEAVLVDLCEKNIQLCKICGDGWGQCRSKGECILKDDFTAIYQQLAESEGIVFVTAVYWHDLTENFKAFLDRLRRCETRHNHWLKDKTCMLVACAGGSGNGAIPCLQKLEVTLKHFEMVPVERLPVTRFSREYMLEALIQAGKTYGESFH
ncbi:MAG: flavodoxin family protein [Erysipelotrichaceae bacterium]|jgi:multimeric flavodoxin WrbA|nr:flavodoxin family protein [Erysipelotrichaceae bacterium]